MIKEGFIKCADQLSGLTEEATADLSSALQTRQYNKGDIITSATVVCRYFYFIDKGLVKYYFINDEGKEIILRFFSEGRMFTSLESFLTGATTHHSIRALEKVQVTYISKEQLETLCQKHHSIERYYRTVLSMANINMIQRISELLSDDATLRYKRFMTRHPELLQRIQLGDLANYLGITQVTLSRIRAVK